MSQQPSFEQWPYDPTLGERMAKAMKVAGYNVKDMSEYFEVSATSVSGWLNDRWEVKASTIKLWALRTGAPVEWIRYGKRPETENPPPPDDDGGSVRLEGFEPPTF